MFASFMSDKMVFRMKVRKEVDVVRGSNGKRVCNNLVGDCQRPGGMKTNGEVGYVTEDMAFLHLSITRFWTKDLRMSGGKIG